MTSSNLGVQLLFLSDLDIGACIIKKMCLLRHSTYNLKVHRISNNMVLKLPAQR